VYYFKGRHPVITVEEDRRPICVNHTLGSRNNKIGVQRSL
jgi:hypothetical protein